MFEKAATQSRHEVVGLRWIISFGEFLNVTDIDVFVSVFVVGPFLCLCRCCPDLLYIVCENRQILIPTDSVCAFSFVCL